jgi:hypothetical protein
VYVLSEPTLAISAGHRPADSRPAVPAREYEPGSGESHDPAPAARANRRTVLRDRPSSAAIAAWLWPAASSRCTSACLAARPVGDPAAALRGGLGRVLDARRVLSLCLALSRPGRDGRCGQVLPVPGDRPLNGLAQVVPQVPPVGDLDRLGRASAAAL